MFVFDITDRDTFKEVAYWMEDFAQFAEGGEKQILLGNKADLQDER